VERVLIASPVNQHPAILKEFAASLLNLELKGVCASFLFIEDNYQEESREILSRLAGQLGGEILMVQSKPDDYRKELGHAWTPARITKVTEFRNRILDHAREKDYDSLFMVDSDLMLHPKTLIHLMTQKKDIVSEIYWTSWTPGSRPFPQVWQCDNYTQCLPGQQDQPYLSRTYQGLKDFHESLKKPGIYKVGGLGGCTLMSRAVLKSPVSYSKIPNLSFLGEDRHFCVRAAVLGFELYVDTCYPAFHLYRLADLPRWESVKKGWEYGVSLAN
jgi:hypothetical protein